MLRVYINLYLNRGPRRIEALTHRPLAIALIYQRGRQRRMRNKKLRSQRLFRWLLLLRAREALILLPAFGTSLSVVSAFVVSHRAELRPLLAR